MEDRPMVGRRSLSISLVLALAGLLLLVQSSLVTASGGSKVLEFKSMVGVAGVFKGAGTPIRGVPGGGLAWAIDAAHGKLSPTGHLEVRVAGLVFAEGPNTGIKTLPSFRAVVSYLDSGASIVNVATDPFPASASGDASVEADLDLPDPCIAPIVFVTSPGGAWFSVTGG